MSKTPRFEIVRPRHFALFPWTWKLVSANGRVVAISWLRFKHAYLARRSATRARNALYGRPVPIYPRRKPKPLRPGELQHLIRKICKHNEKHVLPTLDDLIGLSHTKKTTALVGWNRVRTRKGMRWIPTRLDPTLPPDTAILQSPDGKTSWTLTNIGLAKKTRKAKA